MLKRRSAGLHAKSQREVYCVHSCIPSPTTLSPKRGIPALTSPHQTHAAMFPHAPSVGPPGSNNHGSPRAFSATIRRSRQQNRTPGFSWEKASGAIRKQREGESKGVNEWRNNHRHLGDTFGGRVAHRLSFTIYASKKLR